MLARLWACVPTAILDFPRSQIGSLAGPGEAGLDAERGGIPGVPRCPVTAQSRHLVALVLLGCSLGMAQFS